MSASPTREAGHDSLRPTGRRKCGSPDLNERGPGSGIGDGILRGQHPADAQQRQVRAFTSLLHRFQADRSERGTAHSPGPRSQLGLARCTA